MKVKEVIEHLRNSNPYPVSIFTEPTSKEWEKIAPALKANNISPDRVFAKWGRMVWNSCIDQLEELTKEDE